MAKSGPKPTPTETLKLRGSWRSKVRKGEPVAPMGAEPPDWLSPAAIQEWSYIAPILERMAVLTRADRNTLARYCDTLASYRRVSAHVREHGESYETEHGPKRSPESRALVEYLGALLRMEACFGLTPADRASLVVAPESKPGSIEEWLAG